MLFDYRMTITFYTITCPVNLSETTICLLTTCLYILDFIVVLVGRGEQWSREWTVTYKYQKQSTNNGIVTWF